MPTITYPKTYRFVVSVKTPTGGGYATTRLSLNDAIAEGLNHARYLLRGHAPTRDHVEVMIEGVCAVCSGTGGAGKRACPSCRGGQITHPISGPQALRLIVHEAGAVTPADPDRKDHCECSPELCEGSPGAVCGRCARAVASVAPSLSC